MFLTPRWIASHVFVAALIAAFIAAGFWQLNRLEQRQALNELIVERINEPSAQPSELISFGLGPGGSAEPADFEYRSVVLDGRFDPNRSVLIANRSSEGLPGFWLWAVFALEDGAGEILVNRGFIARTTIIEGLAPQPPSGTQIVRGRLRLGLDGGRVGEAGDQINRPDPQVAAEITNLDNFVTSEFYVQSTDEVVAPLFVLPPPDLGEGPHRSYAFQWFTFTTIGVIGYAMTLKRIRRGDTARGDVPHHAV